MDGTGLHHLRVLRRESHPSQVRPHLSAPSVSEQSGGAKSGRRGKQRIPPQQAEWLLHLPPTSSLLGWDRRQFLPQQGGDHLNEWVLDGWCSSLSIAWRTLSIMYRPPTIPIWPRPSAPSEYLFTETRLPLAGSTGTHVIEPRATHRACLQTLTLTKMKA